MSSPVDFALHMFLMHDVMSFCMRVVDVSKQLFLGIMIVCIFVLFSISLSL